MFFLKTCELGAVHLLCHTGWGWLGVSKSMTHYETLVGVGVYDQLRCMGMTGASEYLDTMLEFRQETHKKVLAWQYKRFTILLRIWINND